MKMESDRPTSVNGVAVSCEKIVGWRIARALTAAANTVITIIFKAIRLAIDPLSVKSTSHRVGLARRITAGP